MADINDEMYDKLKRLYCGLSPWELLEEIFKLLDQDTAEHLIDRLMSLHEMEADE